jgi:membrane protein implicated in regulation of membrane protease activity
MMIPAASGWLIAAAVLLGLEAFGAPGIGFLFAGLSALVVGILIWLELIGAENWFAQAGIFFFLTVAFAGLLWNKLKKWRMDPDAEQYNNTVGDMATVSAGGLRKGAVGQVSWSGTTMNAMVSADEPSETFTEGDIVTIVAVKGNRLIVKK